MDANLPPRGTAVIPASLMGHVAQYLPILGGWETFGEPWSEARRGLIPAHVLLIAAIGAGVAWFVMWRTGTAPKPVASPPGGAS